MLMAIFVIRLICFVIRLFKVLLVELLLAFNVVQALNVLCGLLIELSTGIVLILLLMKPFLSLLNRLAVQE